MYQRSLPEPVPASVIERTRVGMIERDLQRRVAAHRQADDMRALDLEMIEHGDAIAHHMV